MKGYRFVAPHGPLAPYTEGYSQHLEELSYTFGSLQWRMVQFNQLSRWLEAEGFGLA